MSPDPSPSQPPPEEHASPTRVRTAPRQAPHVCATWCEDTSVRLWDLSHQLGNLHAPGKGGGGAGMGGMGTGGMGTGGMGAAGMGMGGMGMGGMGGMGGAFGAVSSAPHPSAPFTYGGFAGGAPQQGGPMQMPSAPFQAGMRAGSVGNQMGGLNNMYSNFAAPSPMPAPPPPMFGAPAGNSKAMMGPRPVGIF